MNAPFTVRIGNLYNNGADSNSLVKLAVTNINNDPLLLPNVKIELYSINFTTGDQATYGALTLSETVGVSALIVNSDDAFHSNVHTVASAFQVPHFSIRAVDDAFRQKKDFPMLTRVFPTSSSITIAMASFVKSLNYTGALIITTKESHVSASAITTTEQFANMSITNVHTVQIPNYATKQDAFVAVEKCKQLIRDNQLRPILFLTTAATGLVMLDALGSAKLYGPDLLYLFSHENSRSVLGALAPAVAKPIVDGSMCFIPVDGLGTNYPSFLSQWASVNRTIFPGRVPPQSQLFTYDAPYVYAHALHAVLAKKGFSNVTASDILQASYDASFMGVSGPVNIDRNRDYIAANGMGIFNVLNISTFNYTTSARYNTNYNNITILKDLYFFGLSTTPPNPGYCKFCFNGTCNAQSICVCQDGFTGEYCSSLISPPRKNDNTLLKIIVPIAGAFMIGCIIAVYYFKKRREQLVLDISKRQRSDISRSEIKLLDRIGRGASGTVYKSLFRGTEVAAKSILTGSSSSAAVEEFKMETAIMCALRHPNIVLFMGSCFDTTTKEMLLVMEFCSRGSLHDLLNDNRVTLPYELILHLACQSSQGMNFLHESIPPIIHRDLKSHNILLDDKFNAKISDFGLTRFKETSKKNSESKHESIGTVFWSAPEVLNGQVHTEKSDCYSFGIVLWEMFHRSDPYPNMDLVTVAMDVMNKAIRPIMNPQTPQEIQELIRDCWQQEPSRRPSFQQIMNTLRTLSMQHPMYSFATGHQSRVEAPSGNIYIVHSKIDSLFGLFDLAPRATNKAFTLHNHLIRSNLELYNGYEAKFKKDGFMVAFSNIGAAINWCISTQVSLLNLKWPEELLRHPQASRVEEHHKPIWCGLRVRMSIISGTPNQDVDNNGQITYSGPVIEEAKSMLKKSKRGSIIVSEAVLKEIESNSKKLIEQVNNFPSDIPSYHEILPISLVKRHVPETVSSPSYIVSLEDTSTTLESVENRYNTDTEESGDSSDRSEKREKINRAPSTLSLPPWMVPMNKIIIKDSIGKGQVGDYSRAMFNSQEVVVKLLVNQKLREEDLLSLISDCSLLYKIRHPNLVPVKGVCLKPSNISIIMDFMNGGNLNDMLLNLSIPVTNSQLISIARQIATGMTFLTNYEDAALHIHDNFKSNNILLTKDGQVKITDYGQTNIKDLARTMTSISSVAWTAPEILNGERMTPQSTVYSFGIILWEMFARKVPYQGEHPLKVVSKILGGFRPPIPMECPPNVKSLINSCWHEAPDQRPTWNGVLSELYLISDS